MNQQELSFRSTPQPTRFVLHRRLNVSRGPLAFFATAALSGILFHFLFFSINFSKTELGSIERVERPPWPSWWKQSSGNPEEEACAAPPPASIETVTVTLHGPAPTATIFKDGWGNGHGLNDMTLSEIREMVSKTKGLYARDFSLGLGWNNMRYIIEPSLLHATLLNRTLVVPSFVYSRSCEFDILVCAAFSKMVNRGDAVGWTEWEHLPLDRQVGWRIPLEIMLDIPRLRKKYPVILVSEYLQMQGLPTNYEWANGMWHRDVYHSGDQPPSLHIIPNGDWDPEGVVRVDRYDKPSTYPPLSSEGQRLAALLQEKAAAVQKPVLNWSEARLALAAAENVTADDVLERLVTEAGWTIVHTWNGSIGLDYTKAVVEPVQQVAPRHTLCGAVNDWDDITADVLLLEGEIHLHRKPGFLRFMTIESRDAFAEMVLGSFRPADRVMTLAAKIAARMTEANGGRQWMGAHMRRGDFVEKGWVMELTLEAHIYRVKRKLEIGRQLLEKLKAIEPKAYNVPNARINHAIRERPLPLSNDTIFVATDEKDPVAIKYIKGHGMLLFDDLVTVNDRREFGWPILLSDVVALVEQAALGIGASYFYAHALSSVPGGVLNLRAISGMDPRTATVD